MNTNLDNLLKQNKEHRDLLYKKHVLGEDVDQKLKDFIKRVNGTQINNTIQKKSKDR